MTPIDFFEPPPGYDLSPMTSSFAETIRENRTRLGWSQRTLARQAGVTPGYIALLEKGTRAPGDELWDRLGRLFGAGVAQSSDLGEWSFGSGKTSTLADVLSNTRSFEFNLPLPEESDWFDTVPFTTVVGPLGSGKTTYVARWLYEIVGRTGRQIVWVQLKPTSEPEDIQRQVMDQVSTEGFTPLTAVSNIGMAAALVRQLEGNKRPTPIICFDDWEPLAGGAHGLVSDLAVMLQRTPVVATTVNARSGLGTVTVRPMPRPTESDWTHWCDRWQVPPTIRTDFLERIHHNPLAASLYKGSVFFSSDATTIDSNWRGMVGQMPSQAELQWDAVVGQCVHSVGQTGSRVIKLAASAPVPVPYNWLGEDASTADTSKLLEYHLARFVTWEGLNHLTVHPVFQQNFDLLGQDQFPGLKGVQPTRQLVETLLNVAMYEDAAISISRLVESVLPSSEASNPLIEWADRLPDQVSDRHPMVLFGLVRALALREHSGDLSRAMATVEHVLSLSLTDGQRWQALNQGADVAIRALDYVRALDFLDDAERLFETSAGSFDGQALDVLKARIYWEQGEFLAARDALQKERPGTARVESARHASWQARVEASLGDFAAAARAANRGIEISRRTKAPRPEAYNTVLLAEYELVRGNLGRAHRLAERAAHLADSRGLPNLRAQALAAQAEAAAAQGDPKEAHRLLDFATDEVLKRGDDRWTNAYRLVTDARLVRLQPRQWTQLWSLAQSLQDEAYRLAAQNDNHPVVGDLLIESAHCWAATGYSHLAQKLIDDLGNRRVNWRTRFESGLLSVVTQPECSDDERYDAVVDLIEEARDAGAPYLAVSCPYMASTYRLVGGDDAMANRFGPWISDVAASRGWTILASKARALVPMAGSAAKGELAVRNEGETSFAAPRRAQQASRADPEAPLPDPFDD